MNGDRSYTHAGNADQFGGLTQGVGSGRLCEPARESAAAQKRAAARPCGDDVPASPTALRAAGGPDGGDQASPPPGRARGGPTFAAPARNCPECNAVWEAWTPDGGRTVRLEQRGRLAGCGSCEGWLRAAARLARR